MGADTNIEWADHTFNPWVGCEKVSPGCAHCYAETLVTGRMARGGTWGADGRRERTSPSTWAAPLRYEKHSERFFEEHGRRQRVFCASLADVFEPRPELLPWRAELFDLIRATPSLDWLILTKRPEEAKAWFERILGPLDRPLPFPNVWLGTSIENARHTYRADILREIPAAVRFISAEPLLGSLFEVGREGGSSRNSEVLSPVPDGIAEGAMTGSPSRRALDLTGIDWVIVGGESGGKQSRPMHPDWAREIRDACATRCCGQWASECCGRVLGTGECCNEPEPVCCNDPERGPAFLFKQWGSWVPSLGGSMTYAGAAPKSGGRLLDGREWTEFPASKDHVHDLVAHS